MFSVRTIIRHPVLYIYKILNPNDIRLSNQIVKKCQIILDIGYFPDIMSNKKYNKVKKLNETSNRCTYFIYVKRAFGFLGSTEVISFLLSSLKL